MFSLIAGLVFFREFNQGSGRHWRELAVNCLHETTFFAHLLMYIGHGRLRNWVLDKLLDKRRGCKLNSRMERVTVIRFVPSRRSSAGDVCAANRCNVWLICELPNNVYYNFFGSRTTACAAAMISGIECRVPSMAAVSILCTSVCRI